MILFSKSLNIPFLLTLAMVAVFATAQARPAAAQSTPGDELSTLNIKQSLALCVDTVSRVSRLICYDDLAAKLGYIPDERAAREEAVLEKYGFWEVMKRRNAAGEEIIYLKNDAMEEVISKSGLQRKPTLIIKCKSGQTDVYLDWKAQLVPRTLSGSTLGVVTQFGAGVHEDLPWELSTDRNAIFSPNPVEFVKRMRQNDRLVIQVTPPYDIAQTIVHDISGLNAVLELLVAQCYK